MNGGVASRSIAVTVGSINTHQAEGQIVSSTGAPVPGVRVHNGKANAGYRGGYSDRDGHYLVPNLAPGEHTLFAVKFGFAIQPAGWANPVVVTNNIANLNWAMAVNPGAPNVTWSHPPDIQYGVPLSRDQLSAEAAVAGTFEYEPPFGTGLDAGPDQPLLAVFSPDDPILYAMTTNQVRIHVQKVPLTVQPLDQLMIYGAALPELTFTLEGFVNGDSVDDLDTLPMARTVATSSDDVGGYPITAEGGGDANYSFLHASGSLNILPAAVALTFSAQPNPAQAGHPVVLETILRAQAPSLAVPGGTVVFFIGAAGRW
jgi:hypothetical protein